MVDPHNIEGCEDLLESYFMQVSCCSPSLSAVGGSQHIVSCVSLAACRSAYLTKYL